MRAAFLLAPGSIEIREIDDLVAGSGEVVVAIECATTCGTDLKAYRRGHPFIPMPGRFGHQYSGRIASVGPDVSAFEPGQPILGVHSGPCGQCRMCAAHRPNLCRRFQEQLVIGTFAEQVRLTPWVVRSNLHARPDGMSARRAAFLEPVSCVVHALELLSFRGVDRVLVLGLGSMGLLFLQLLPFYTQATIVAAGRRAERLSMARAFRASDVWDVEAQGVPERLSDGPDFDCVIECTGRPEGWGQAIDATLPGGQVMLFGGLAKGSTFPIDTYRLHYEELRVLGSFHFTPEDVRRSAELLADPKLDVDRMIKDQFPLDRLEEGLLSMAEGKAIKYAIVP